MAEEFLLDCKLDQPAVLAGRSADVYSLVTIRPNPSRLGTLMESGDTATLPAHFVVIVDVSGSMHSMIEPDPKAKVIGSTSIEGVTMSTVETEVPSRRQVAIKAVLRLVERMGSADRMTLVAFDDQSHVLAEGLPLGEKLQQAVRELVDVGGGGTCIGRAFESIRKSLPVNAEKSETRRIVLLTDGEDSDADMALQEAAKLGTEYRLPIFALGTGDSRADFLMKLCGTTLGGSFDSISNEREAEAYFDKFFTSQKKILATNVQLQLWLSPEIFVRELYRTKPELLFVGDMQPDSGNTVRIPIEYMDRDKAYEFLFRGTIPARDPGRFRLAKATLTFDIPAMGLTGGRVEANIVAELTSDSERTLVRVGDVRKVISEAETQRQTLFLQEKKDLIESGRATDKDRTIVARTLDALIKKFTELGNQANLNQYQMMKAEYERTGAISQETMNRSLAASSKVEGAVVVQELDDF